jgi:tetratricopeptide (TPR) repeat protein
MLLLVLPLGVLTATSESALSVNRGFSWDPTFFERLLNAGRSICFYAWKLVWPREFTFIYSGWKTDTSALAQYLFPLAALALPGVLWLLRGRLGRGPLVAVLYYGGTLFPALGFLEIYFFRFAPVADHWQYLGCIGVFALLVGSVHRLVELLPITRPVAIIASVLALVFLGDSSHQYAYAFHNSEALFQDSLSKNPDSVMVRFNLGTLLQERNALDEAETHFKAALAIDSQDVGSIHNLGFLYFQEGDVERAIQQFRQCLELAPFHIRARFNLGIALERQGRIEEAFQEIRRALETDPADALPWLTLGESKRIYLGHFQFGDLLLKHDHLDEAAVQYRKALSINPSHAPSHIRLGTLFAKQGNRSKAANHFRIALRINPRSQIARRHLDRLQASGSSLQRSPAPANRSGNISQPQSEQ